MTLNVKIGVLWIFWAISGCETHFKSGLRDLRRNQYWDRHRKTANEIFNIERRFQRFKSRFSRFKETCARGHQRAVPRLKSLFYCCWPVFC